MKKHKAADDNRRPAPRAFVPEHIEAAALAQTPSAVASVADAARQKMIAEAAYYRAEKRGFAPGYDLEDWLAAEAEVPSASLEQASLPAELH